MDLLLNPDNKIEKSKTFVDWHSSRLNGVMDTFSEQQSTNIPLEEVVENLVSLCLDSFIETCSVYEEIFLSIHEDAGDSSVEGVRLDKHREELDMFSKPILEKFLGILRQRFGDTNVLEMVKGSDDENEAPYGAILSALKFLLTRVSGINLNVEFLKSGRDLSGE